MGRIVKRLVLRAQVEKNNNVEITEGEKTRCTVTKKHQDSTDHQTRK